MWPDSPTVRVGYISCDVLSYVLNVHAACFTNVWRCGCACWWTDACCLISQKCLGAAMQLANDKPGLA